MPLLKTNLETSTPYLNQTIVYTASLHSSGNVKSIQFNPPKINGASVELLSTPENTVSQNQSQKVFITTVRYLITPLVAGSITIPPMSADLVLQEIAPLANRPTYTWPPIQNIPAQPIEETRTIRTAAQTFQVLPIPEGKTRADIQALWLPLSKLDIQTQLTGIHHGQQQGEITLTVNWIAIGNTLRQLPALAQLIDTYAFKTYCRNPQFQQAITPQQQLSSQRMETCTLVPRQTGTHTIQLNMPWWNTRTHQVEQTIWQSAAFQVNNTQFTMAQALPATNSPTLYSPDTDKDATSTLLSLSNWQVGLLIFTSILLALSLTWAWLFQIRLRLPLDWLNSFKQLLREHWTQVSCRLIALQSLKIKCCFSAFSAKKYNLQRFIPRAIKLKRFCCQLDQAQSAHEVNQVLCQYLCQQNCMSRAVNRNFVQEFTLWGKNINQDRVTQLFAELEAAQYGQQEWSPQVLSSWKQEFYELFAHYLFKSKPVSAQQPAENLAQRCLPALNLLNHY